MIYSASDYIKDKYSQKVYHKGDYEDVKDFHEAKEKCMLFKQIGHSLFLGHFSKRSRRSAELTEFLNIKKSLD